MQQFKLANILIEDTVRAMQAPALYCRSTAPFRYDREQACSELIGTGTFDFTTYFNSFSAAKWKRYTTVEKVFLHLEAKGSAAQIILVHADEFSPAPETVENGEHAIEASDEWVSLDIEIPLADYALVAFMIKTQGTLALRNGHYYANVEESQIRPIELALATTTFRKEEFVVPNVELFKSELLESDDAIAQHFAVHVIDNGRTLDVEQLQSDRVFVHPNKNVGGSGGFTRGMIEVLRGKQEATHVLLMDDDVEVSPESIKRTYNLLSLLNDEYKDAFISGAMLDYDIPDNQWEDIGYIDNGGFFRPVKTEMRVSLLRDLTQNECFVVNREETYAAWWYCCIPVSTIKREGLPLPVFIRCDDTEYSLRCKPKIITMSGICIWHVGFHSRYNAAVERYQTMRNTLAANAISGIAPYADFLYQYKNAVQVDLKKFNYKDASLAIDGFEDFLKGPDFLKQDLGEKLFMEKGKAAEKLKSFKELKEDVPDLNVSRSEVYEDVPRSRSEKLIDFITFNGQRTPYTYRNGKDCAVIPSEGWLYPAGKIRGANTLLAIDTYNKKGILRHKDRDQFKQVWGRYKRLMKEYKRRKPELEASYAAAKEELTSMEFWMKYLEID